jgi:hypothetical protein
MAYLQILDISLLPALMLRRQLGRLPVALTIRLIVE